MLRARPVVGAEEPRFQVAEHDVQHGQVLLCQLARRVEDERMRARSPSSSAGCTPASRPCGRVSRGRHAPAHEPLARLRLSVRDDLETEPAGVVRAFVALAILLALADLYGAEHVAFVVDPSALALGASTDKRLVHLRR